MNMDLETTLKGEHGLCFFNKMFRDDKSIDLYNSTHPMYICKYCNDTFNEDKKCTLYEPLKYVMKK